MVLCHLQTNLRVSNNAVDRRRFVIDDVTTTTTNSISTTATTTTFSTFLAALQIGDVILDILIPIGDLLGIFIGEVHLHFHA